MLEYKVTRWSVRQARQRAGAPPHSRGRRRGAQHVPQRFVPTAAELIADRIREEDRPDGPAATLELVAERVLALHDANRANDRPARRDALISLASACGLVLDHLDLLEAA